jgi:WD40 repeat protein
LLQRIEQHEDLIYDVGWVGDANQIATASADRTVRIWDIRGGRCVAILAGHSGAVLCLAVAPDGSYLCSGSADQTIRVWDTRDWHLIRSLDNHLGPVHALEFRREPESGPAAARPHLLASAGGDSTVRIWQPAIGRMMRIVRHPAPVLSLAWGTSERLYSGARDGRLRTIAVEEGRITSDKLVFEGWMSSLVIRQRDSTILAGSTSGEVSIILN